MNGPAIGAGGAVEHIPQGNHRQHEGAYEQRLDVVGFDLVAKQIQRGDAGGGYQRGRHHRKYPRCRGEPHDGFVSSRRSILWKEPDNGSVKPEAGKIAQDNNDHPDKDENAVFEFAHQAGQDYLGNKGDRCADNADGKGNHGHAACRTGFVRRGQERGQTITYRHQPRCVARRQYFAGGVDQRHGQVSILLLRKHLVMAMLRNGLSGNVRNCVFRDWDDPAGTTPQRSGLSGAGARFPGWKMRQKCMA